MTASAPPEPLTLSQWNELLPLAAVAVGAVVRVAVGTADEHLLAAVIETDEFEAIVAPLSDDVEVAAEWDLLIGPDAVGWPAAVEVWNSGTVLLEQVEETLGHLPDFEAERLETLYAASLDGTPASLPPGSTGPRVISAEDPRLLHQEEAFEHARTYFIPASTFTDVGSLPALFEQRAVQRGLTLRDVDKRLDDDVPWLPELAERGVDLRERVPARDLLKVFTELDIPVCRRSFDLVHREAYQSLSAGSFASGTVLARRRRGVSSRTPAVTPERRQAAALGYLNALAKAARR